MVVHYRMMLQVQWLFIGAKKLIFPRLWCCKRIVLQVLYFVTLNLWNLSVQEPSVSLCMHTLNLTILIQQQCWVGIVLNSRALC
jgi:hypothetical protein